MVGNLINKKHISRNDFEPNNTIARSYVVLGVKNTDDLALVKFLVKFATADHFFPR
jgi:hypothetical protein